MQNLFETVLHRMENGVVVTDETGNLVYANARAQALLGLELVEGMPIAEQFGEKRGLWNPNQIKDNLAKRVKEFMGRKVELRHGELGSFQGHVFTMNSLHGNPPNDRIFVKKENGFERIDLGSVKWIEAMENYALLHTEEDRVVVHATMKSLARRLEHNGFVRVHRSYIVQIDAIDRIEENHCIVGSKRIPIGKSYRGVLMEKLRFI